MVNMSQKRRKAALLPYSTIEAATTGNMDAIQAVLLYYARYMDTLSERRMYDEDREVHICTDDELRCRLEAKLIAKILCFDAGRVI